MTPAGELALAPGQEVEGDIICFRQYPIWHMLDRSDRWHAAKVLDGDLNDANHRSSESLCAAIMSIWIGIFGPFKILVI